jgi:Zn-finger nucleic acid-binding protein
MPYMSCPRCRLSTFTAARHSGVDTCPRCGSELDHRPAPLFRDRVRRSLQTTTAGDKNEQVARSRDLELGGLTEPQRQELRQESRPPRPESIV